MLYAVEVFVAFLAATKPVSALDYTWGSGQHTCEEKKTDCSNSRVNIESGSSFGLECKGDWTCHESTLVVHSGCTLSSNVDCDGGDYACNNATMVVYSSDLASDGYVIDCGNMAFVGICNGFNLTLVDSHATMLCRFDDCNDIHMYLYGSSMLSMKPGNFGNATIYLYDDSEFDANDNANCVVIRVTPLPTVITTTTLEPPTSTSLTTTPIPTTTSVSSTRTPTDTPTRTSTALPTTTSPRTTVLTTPAATTSTNIGTTTPTEGVTTKQPLTTSVSTNEPITDSPTTTLEHSDTGNDSSDWPVIFGAIGGGIGLLSIVIVAIYYLCHKCDKEDEGGVIELRVNSMVKTSANGVTQNECEEDDSEGFGLAVTAQKSELVKVDKMEGVAKDVARGSVSYEWPAAEDEKAAEFVTPGAEDLDLEESQSSSFDY